MPSPMSRHDECRQRIREWASQDTSLSTDVHDAFCALGVGIPFAQRTEAVATALQKLRMCSPVVMRAADAESDGMPASLTPLLVDYLNSLTPDEMMLIRRRDGNVMAPLFDPAAVDNEDTTQVKCSNCDADTFRIDLVTCSAATCEFCRECFVSSAVDVVRGVTGCCMCLVCGSAMTSENAVAQLKRLLGPESPSSDMVVQLRKKLAAAAKRMCPLHATVELRTDDSVPQGHGHCVHCGKVYCVSCLQMAHGATSCDEALAERSRDQVQRWRLRLEQILSLSCPRCKKVFDGVDGCFDVRCAKDDFQGDLHGTVAPTTCSCHFCGFCNKDCAFDAHSHLDPERQGPCPLQLKYFPHLSVAGSERGEGIDPPYFFPQRYLKLGTGVRAIKKIKNLLKAEFPQQCAAESARQRLGPSEPFNVDPETALFNAIRRDVLPQLLAGGGYVCPDSLRNYPDPSPSVFSDEHGVAADDVSSDEELINHPEVTQDMISRQAFLQAQADELGLNVDEVEELLEAQLAMEAAA